MNYKYVVTNKVIPLQTLKPLCAALLLAAAPFCVQAAGPEVPDAGSILREIQPLEAPVPSSTGTGLRIVPSVSTLPASAPFRVKALRISGNTAFDNATLHALVAEAENTDMTLSQLGELTDRITAYYREQGYPLARAIIPAQTIRDGQVLIQVVEAHYGEISLDNRSRVKDSLLTAALVPLKSGQAIRQTALDQQLLLLSDIPGIAIKATLKPGQAVGTSDLQVDTLESPRVSANLTLDGYGNRATGRERLGGTLNINNLSGHGDVLSLSALSSGSGLNYGRLGYESLVNGQGTRVGGSYSALDYQLAEEFEDLDAHGNAQVGSLWAKHPLIRSRNLNLSGQIQYDRLRLRDRVDLSEIRTDRHLDNGTASLAGDARDTLGAGSISLWSLGVTVGRVAFDDSVAEAADAASANSQGGFSKWNASLTHLQRLSPNTSLYLTLSGQWADGNLDSSQKMSAGGPYSVRAYDIGALSGDSGYSGSVELRHDLGMTWAGQWQALAFIDSAQVTLNQDSWSGLSGANKATLSGAGVGLNWTGPNQWSAKASIAAPIGATPALLSDADSVRGWLAVSRGF
ncbi:ShlB/FhaC/HecB family hemolysin secretion/activation protein [Neptunomonas antarctica]|uniref:Hemolysin activation/secretion protein n=1 Tax=Neptunomonas antarctica TaxID=619304 RepID=A0A1N7K3F4_9GAMM|nr:ShlB/FhaC/HecB family hemolysin secretion/activation protein [Neptunomonas antarctica]SIS56099.1 Hemolysin activation/secretion protein [Neptunomonas antarctica]